jgi:uncharacterized protein
MFNKGQIDSKVYSFTGEMSNLDVSGEGIPFSGPVTVNLNATGSDDTIFLEGDVSGKLNLQCVRCLEQYEFPFSITFGEVYTRKELEETAEEIRYSGDFIDIEPEVQKSLFLCLPMKAVCREDCQGLCPHCGQDLNKESCQCTGEITDPRFNVLQKLLKE